VPALLALAPATARAQEDEGEASIEPAGGHSYIWEGSRITPTRVLSSARLRKRDGLILLGIGGLAMTVGAGLMIGEAAVMPRPGEVKVWSKTGCWISFDFGLVLLPLGLHAAIAGIAMLARGKSHDRLAEIMSLEGPGPIWLEWHSTGKATRILGSVMTLVGTGFLAASMAIFVPHFTCDRWECNAWPEAGEWEATPSPLWMLPLGFGIAGLFASALGIIMLVAGYLEQSRFLENRHDEAMVQERDPVSLAPTPTGLALVW
jgi:hypothetical protein